jgi:hypothetical protein
MGGTVMGRSRLYVLGLDKAIKGLNKAMNKVENHTSEGFYRAGSFLLRKSKEQVPVDTGNLRASGRMIFVGKNKNVRKLTGVRSINTKRVDKTKLDQTKANISLMETSSAQELIGDNTYGFIIFYAANYANVQHEMPYNHKVGNWKYLQKPTMEYRREIIRIIQSYAKKGFKK